jgi:putative hydrolase of the HAD superfamily
LRLEDAFDEIFIADEVGLVKPDVRVFRLAAERLGVAPERCAMVGDRFDRDVRGAHDAGMFTLWMNVRNESVPPEGPVPDAIVSNIGQVEAALPLAKKR